MSDIDEEKWMEFIKDSEGYTIEAGGAFIEELQAKSSFSLWLDYCEMKEELQKVKQERDEAVIQSIGWMYAYCCTLADKGVDIRKLEVPVIMEDFAKTQHGTFLNKIGDV